MSNSSGTMHAITTLTPILNDPNATPSHDLQLRQYLTALPIDARSPFAAAASTHFARLVVMDDVIYVGAPADEDHLKSKYLLLEANSDQDPDTYFADLARLAPDAVDALWGHCVAYPGCHDIPAFVSYMKTCQLDTNFYFVAVNDRTLGQTLSALRTQRLVADFIVDHQGSSPAQIQREFLQFAKALRSAPPPQPAELDTYNMESIVGA